MGNENSSNVWYIPQGVSLELLKTILGHCYNSQKRSQPITGESIKKTITKTEKTVGYALKMLENMGILTLNADSDTYSLNETAMSLAEKLNTKEEVTKEINEIIEHSFLGEILQIILSNEKITKLQLTEKILLNSAAGMVKETRQYMTTIYCILEILNLSGKIPSDKYVELRGSSEQTTKRTHPQVGPKRAADKKRENLPVNDIKTSLESGILGIVKTDSIEIKIKSKEDLEFAKLALNNLEKIFSSSTNDNTSPSTQQLESSNI